MQISISRTEAFGWGDGSHNYSAIGYGATPQAAELDLLDQIEDEEDEKEYCHRWEND